MSDQKPCVRCGRPIDGFARLCLYCNWNQDLPVPAETARSSSGSSYVPPPDRQWQKPVFGAIGGVVLLIAAFVIGAGVHGHNPPPTATHDAPVATPAPAPVAISRSVANVTLVPDNGAAPAGDLITSAPAVTATQGMASEYERTDATAASSDEYSQMAKRVRAEKKEPVAIVDPRKVAVTLPGTEKPAAPRRPVLGDQLPRANQNQPVARRGPRTPPVPEYQPLPDIRVRANVTARIELSIGADGRVHEVNIIDPVPGDTAKLIGAVQSWRFRPATENGVPVAAIFSTAISFHANE